MEEPLLAGDHRHARLLAAGVVLHDDRAEPLDDLQLHIDRARCRRMHDELQAGQVELQPLVIRQLQHADEHRRHELHVRHLVGLDRAQALERVEALHQHDRAAVADRAHRPCGRRRVVHRRWAQVDRRVVETERKVDGVVDAETGAERRELVVGLDPFGHARRAG